MSGRCLTLSRCVLAAVAVLLCAQLVTAQTTPTSDAPRPAVGRPGGLAPVDWAIIVVYALSVIGIGWYYSRKQEDTREYFIGSGRMNAALIGVSLFATLLSTISYLSYPGEIIAKGPAMLAYLAHIPVSFVIVGFLLIPVYLRRRVTSAYELLEQRLGLEIRLLGAIMFIALRLVWMSLLVYAAGKAMTVMMGIPKAEQGDYIPLVVLIAGFVAVIYTSLGGLRAVVITDLMQTILLFGGALLVILFVTIHFGGFGWFPTTWQAHWDTQPFFSFDPTVRATIVFILINAVLWQVCTAGGDQTAVQRFMATGSVKAARRSYLMNLGVGAVVLATLCVVGFALMGYVQANPGAVPPDMRLTDKTADDMFPHFIAFHLPAGVSGLVVAAMFAAAMSSIDSGVNSITAVVMTDFLDRFGRRPKTERGHVLLAKGMAFAIGAVVVVGSSFMGSVPGNITGMTARTTNLLVTPIFVLFFFALFVPFASPAGVVLGAIAGVAVAILTAFSGPIFDMANPISPFLVGAASLLVNIIVGLGASLALPRRRAAG